MWFFSGVKDIQQCILQGYIIGISFSFFHTFFFEHRGQALEADDPAEIVQSLYHEENGIHHQHNSKNSTYPSDIYLDASDENIWGVT